jgi:FkbM family methyltransferase
MSCIVFDVGANDGSSCIKFAENFPPATVYAFEPTPKLVSDLLKKTEYIPTYHVIPNAVSDVEGKATFYIAGSEGCDWGCSSLNNFSDDLDKTWPGREDFKVTDKIEVDVIRLDTFIKKNNIPRIDYLHVDVQGRDLEVLMSLGDEIGIVRNGVIEMATHADVKLYKEQKYTLVDAIKFLNTNGFMIQAIQPNDIFCNEVNVHFVKR